MSDVEKLGKWIEDAATGEEDRPALLAWYAIRGQLSKYDANVARLQARLAAAQRTIERIG